MLVQKPTTISIAEMNGDSMSEVVRVKRHKIIGEINSSEII